MSKIYVPRHIRESGLDFLKERGHNVILDMDKFLSQEAFVEHLKKEDYVAILPLLTQKIDASVFDAAPNLKIVANYAVGYDNIDLKEAEKRGIIITNTPNVLTDAVAEHTICLAMAIGRRVVESDEYMRTGQYKSWGPELLLGREFRGGRLTLLGAGRIGSRVGEIARKGLGMEVHYYDVNRNPILEKECDAIFHESLEEAVMDSDIISVHMPLLESTRGIIGEKLINKMHPKTLLVNTARGPIIDEKALVVALRENKITGAALDVFECEPFMAEGLKDMKNVIVTPHTASATEKARQEMSLLAAQNIDAVLSGGKPITQVKPR